MSTSHVDQEGEQIRHRGTTHNPFNIKQLNYYRAPTQLHTQLGTEYHHRIPTSKGYHSPFSVRRNDYTKLHTKTLPPIWWLITLIIAEQLLICSLQIRLPGGGPFSIQISIWRIVLIIPTYLRLNSLDTATSYSPPGLTTSVLFILPPDSTFESWGGCLRTKVSMNEGILSHQRFKCLRLNDPRTYSVCQPPWLIKKMKTLFTQRVLNITPASYLAKENT